MFAQALVFRTLAVAMARVTSRAQRRPDLAPQEKAAR